VTPPTPTLPRKGGGRRIRFAHFNQPNQSDIRAAADALQHQMAAADTPFGAALLQRFVARLLKAGLGEIAKAEPRSRGVAGSNQRAVAVERRAFDAPTKAPDGWKLVAGETKPQPRTVRPAGPTTPPSK